MRYLLCVVALWAPLALAQTDAPATPAETPAPAESTTPPAAESTPPAAAPGQCSADSDCPGALFCVSGQCVAKQEEAKPSTSDVQVKKVAPSKPAHTHVGINLDVGIPDGVGLGAMYRPFRWLRVGAAMTYNGAGLGARGLLTLAPIDFPITPTLTAEAGHFFASDATSPGRLAPITAALESALPGTNAALAGYDYVNLHLGVEIGSSQHFMFYLRAGGSYFQTKVGGAVLQDAFGDPTLEVDDIHLRAIIPSLKLGFVIFFL